MGREITGRAWNGSLAKAASAMAVVLLGSWSATARAQNVVISDGQFNDADWSWSLVANTSVGWGHVPDQQYPTGGNPDAFRGAPWMYNPPAGETSSITTFNGFTGLTYNPASDGPIQLIDYQVDTLVADTFGGSGSRVIALRPALQQGDSLYQGPGWVTASASWTTLSALGLTPGSFTRVTGTGPVNPNFSASGGAVTFGYFNVLQHNASYDVFHGVDNFLVTLKPPSNLPPTAGPYIVNVDLGHSGGYDGQGVLPSPGNQWNSVLADQLVHAAFKTSTGTDTTVGLRWTPYAGDLQVLNPLRVTSDNLGSERLQLMADGAFNGIDGQTTPDGQFGAEMNITGLVPNQRYNVALYGLAYGAGADRLHLSKFTVNGTAKSTTGFEDAEGGSNVVFREAVADANGELLVQVHNTGATGGYWAVNGLQVENLGGAIPKWQGASGGTWGAGSNWSGAVPNAAGAVAEFGAAAGPVTVNVDGTKTVGTLGFAAAQAYKVTGGAITLDGGGYDALVNVSAGSHEVATPLGVTGSARIALAANTGLKLSGALSGKLSRVVVGDGARLDIGSNALVVDYFGADPTARLRALAVSARGDGSWGGAGITSSLASAPTANGLVGIGIVHNRDAGWAEFDGEVIDATTVIVRATYYGDANLDGRVNADDFALIDEGFAKGSGVWTFGDFNLDGAVTEADYLLIDRTFGLQSGPLSAEFLARREVQFGSDYVAGLVAAIPEPAAGVLAPVALGAMLRRRKRVM